MKQYFDHVTIVSDMKFSILTFNPLMPTGAFNICCPRDCVSRHNGGTRGAPHYVERRSLSDSK